MFSTGIVPCPSRTVSMQNPSSMIKRTTSVPVEVFTEIISHVTSRADASTAPSSSDSSSLMTAGLVSTIGEPVQTSNSSGKTILAVALVVVFIALVFMAVLSAVLFIALYQKKKQHPKSTLNFDRTQDLSNPNYEQCKLPNYGSLFSQINQFLINVASKQYQIASSKNPSFWNNAKSVLLKTICRKSTVSFPRTHDNTIYDTSLDYSRIFDTNSTTVGKSSSDGGLDNICYSGMDPSQNRSFIKSSSDCGYTFDRRHGNMGEESSLYEEIVESSSKSIVRFHNW